MSKAPSNKLSFCVAFCGITTAFSVMLMFISLIPSLAYTAPAAAGIMIYFISEQLGKKWAYLSYLAAGLLSLILVPEIEADLFFISFFGYYPTLRSGLYRIKSKPLRFLAKLAVFNIPVVLTYHLLCFILSADKMLEGMESFGVYAVFVLWGMGNFVFIIYDLVLMSMVKDIYTSVIRPRLNKLMKM